MRLGFLILMLTAIAVTLVHLRREETAVRHEILRLEGSRTELRRQLWAGQVALGYKLRPEDIRRRSEEMALELTDPQGGGAGCVAGRE